MNIFNAKKNITILHKSIEHMSYMQFFPVAGPNGTISLNLPPPGYQQPTYTNESLIANDATKKVLSVSIKSKSIPKMFFMPF